MNEIGIALVWCAIQVTLIGLWRPGSACFCGALGLRPAR